MNDQAQPHGAKYLGRDIGPEDAIRFLQAYTKDHSICPICKEHRWDVILTSKGAYGGIPFLDDDRDGTPAGTTFPVFYTVCTTCGYVNLHSLHKLHRWLASEDEK